MNLKRLPPLLAAAAASLALAACGSSDDSPSATGTGTTAGAEAGAFPVTIEHKYGSTTIESAPRRVVVVGLREQDALLALGVVPVATTEWFGRHPGAIFPWAREALGGAQMPTVLTNTDGVEVERVASLRPDLILSVYGGLTRDEYEKLSNLAPVVAQPRGRPDWGSSWQEETLIAGQAVGKPAAARRLVEETETLIADAAAEHPEFRGQTAAAVTDYQGIFVYGPEDARTRTLEALGFAYPRDLIDAFPDEFGGQISDERVETLDVGALTWLADGDNTIERLKRKPVYNGLSVRREGRDVFIAEDDPVYEAMSFPSVLSMPLLLDEYVPRLAAAADGDPSTSTDRRAAGADAAADASERPAGGFPATVEHKFGTTTVESEPRRIVVVGLTEQDTVLALGRKPIATTEWYGEQPDAVWPWAQEALGDARPEVLSTSDGFEYERIAGLAPDLILGVNAGMKRGDYEKLSRLAPTIAAGRGSTDYFSPWDQQVELISAALGKPEEGRALIERVRDGYARAAEEHPEFADRTVTFSQNAFSDGQIYAYPEGLSTDFLTMLGFTINPKLTPLISRRGEQVGVSEERIDVLDADAIVFATERAADIAALEKVPTFDTLRAVAGGRAVFTDATLAGAMYFETPLSLEYVLERLPPRLEQALAGRSPRRMVGAGAG